MIYNIISTITRKFLPLCLPLTVWPYINVTMNEESCNSHDGDDIAEYNDNEADDSLCMMKTCRNLLKL